VPWPIGSFWQVKPVQQSEVNWQGCLDGRQQFGLFPQIAGAQQSASTTQVFEQAQTLQELVPHELAPEQQLPVLGP
jgi:hypothetical protein